MIDVIELPRQAIQIGGMEHLPRLVLRAATFALLLAAPAHATCYADYKAKQDNPLRLQYGVIELQDPACNRPKLAERDISDRIAFDGWTLLNVLTVFGPDGLAERKESAGQYFLRY